MFSKLIRISALCFTGFLASQFAIARTTPNFPTTMARGTKSSSLDGVWLGTLGSGANVLHGRLDIKTDDAGQPNCTLYSLDQGNQPMPCANVKLNGKQFSFDVPVVKGHWAGTVSANRKNLMGTWNQGSPQPLNWSRQAPSAQHETSSRAPDAKSK